MLVGVIAEELLLPEGGQLADLFIDNDLFLSPAISVPGFLLEGQFDEGDVFYNAYVGDIALGLYPLPVVDNDTIYAFTRAAVTAIAPALFRDDLATDAFYGPKVLDKVLGPALFVDDDLYGGVKKLTRGKATINQTVPIANVVDSDIVYGTVVERSGSVSIAQQATVATEFDVVHVGETTADTIPLLGSFVKETASYTPPPLGYLLPHLFVADDTFFIPNVQGGLSPSLFVDADVFHVPARGNYLAPSTVLADDVIFGPSAGRQLLPGTVVAADVFNGPFVTQPGSFGLVIDAAESIPAPAIAAQRATIDAVLLTETDVFYSPSGGQGLIAPYDPVLGGDSFFVPGAAIGPLAPIVSVIDPDNFFAPGVSGGATTGFDGTIAIDGPIMPSVPQPTVILGEG